MNDDFISRLRAAPRPEFAEALYRRISASERPTPVLGRSFASRRLAWSLAVLGLACLVTLAAFPQARAAVGEAVRRIGAISVWETAEHPYLGGEVRTIPEKLVPLAEVESLLDGRVTLPTWVPEGFILKDKAQLYRDPLDAEQWSVGLIYEHKPSRKTISLFIRHLNQDFVPTEIVGPGSVEEVTIKGQPAALVRGAWNPTTQEWRSTGLVHLHWAAGKMVYQLVTGEGAVSTADLVRMAESME
jgi:hypothetical protein